MFPPIFAAGVCKGVELSLLVVHVSTSSVLWSLRTISGTGSALQYFGLEATSYLWWLLSPRPLSQTRSPLCLSLITPSKPSLVSGHPP